MQKLKHRWRSIFYNIRRTALFALLVLLLIQLNFKSDCFIHAAAANTYYVSPNGLDSNPGTIDAPWQTIQHAADSMVAGDSVFVRSGTYHEQIKPANSGDATAGYITFSAYPNETPVIDGTDVDSGNNGIVIQTSFVKISGFEFRNWPDNGICCWNAGYIEVSDCKIHDSGSGVSFYDGSHDFNVSRVEVYRTNGGFDASPAEGANCYNGVINDVFVHNALDINQAPDGIALGHGGEHNFVFNRCEVSGFFDGFDISANDVQINSCSSHDNDNTGYKIWDDNVTLTNCLGYHNQGNNLQLPYHDIPGTVTLRNCDFVDAQTQNVWVQNETHGLRVYNCIFACSNNVGLDFESLGAGTYQGDYNIFHNINPDRAVVVRDVELEFSLDMVADGNWTHYSGQDQHSIVCNDATQLFVDLANWNLHLKLGSPAIDAGTATNAPQVDRDGFPRPQGSGYDIGAYEWGQSSILSTSPTINQQTISPSAPAQGGFALPTEALIAVVAVIVVIAVAVAVVVLKKHGHTTLPPPPPT